MADITHRPFSKNYSGLINQSVIALGIAVICITSQELMKRKRRGKKNAEGLGSVESWQFGYLFQGRSWARKPSPPSPQGWPLSWVKQTIDFPEDKMNELRGVDATLYTRFLRGCFWFTCLHSITTFPILFPIHVQFSEDSVPPKSMTRASIASLVLTQKGRGLLWIHLCLLIWLTVTWIANLIWICNGAFHMRVQKLEEAAKRAESAAIAEKDHQYHPHPHPQYPFQEPPSLEHEKEGLRLRTVMVSNIPHSLRSEKDLKEYFEYFMRRHLDKPSMGLTSSTQPGFVHKFLLFLFNRAKHIPEHLPGSLGARQEGELKAGLDSDTSNSDAPVINRVVIVRKMTELASLLERREEVLRRLETAHIKLAKKAVIAVKEAMDRPSCGRRLFHRASKRNSVENGDDALDGTVKADDRLQNLVRTLSPYVDEFDLHGPRRSWKSFTKSKRVFEKIRLPQDTDAEASPNPGYPPSQPVQKSNRTTIWESLLNVPRSDLDAYQPLVRLSVVFRDKTVPAIDYYTAKLGLLTSLITENRSKAVSDYDPVATAFVTFADPSDARKACKYLAVHPNNPMACLVQMAPSVEDLDWIRVMKSPFKAEFVKDWIVSIGVWAFTLFWLLPISLLVALVSIQTISVFWPGLKAYLDRHPWQEEVIQSFLPTLIMALLALLIPLLLLLIGKKAHTFTTLSAMHDTIMSRYYKFLVVNVLIFFCVGTAAVQSFLVSFRHLTGSSILNIVADSFPSAGPFYVGWLIFTTAVHGGFELALFGLPLFMYPSTKRQVTPRKRAVGIRPRTFNFYYWLPNHMLIIHILLLFALLNPLVIPFGMLYFFVETGVVKNQLIHVYAKNYEANGQVLLIRVLRYSLDGLMASQVVFMAYMIVLKKSANVGLSAVVFVSTGAVKLFMTRMCRAQFEQDDVAEAQIVCGIEPGNISETGTVEGLAPDRSTPDRQQSKLFGSLRRPTWFSFSYSTIRQRYPIRRKPNPFGPQSGQTPQPFSRLGSLSPELNQAGEGSSRDAAPISTRPRLKRVGRDGPYLPSIDILSQVVPHPPMVTWDDESHIDLPYDNPYYTQSIRNVLWLPRNPFGVLDLDDTVDLHIAITSEPTAGQLGTWLGIAETTASPIPISMPSTSGSPPEESVPDPTPPRQYTGLEEIELPSGIARRIQRLDKEEDVEYTLRGRRPSFFSLKSNVAEGNISTPRLTVRRPSQASTTAGIRTFSAGDRRPRASSVLSVMDQSQHDRSENEVGMRPDMHAQADLARSHLGRSHTSVAQLGLGLPPGSPRQPMRAVTTQEALVHELIAEEEDALAERLKQEQAEADAATKGTRSWLTSWMFRRHHEQQQ